VTVPEQALELFTFGPFTLDPFGRTLDSHASPVRLEARPFELLEYFVHNAGSRLSKETIATSAWQVERVAEDDVDAYVVELRAVLARYSPRTTFIVQDRDGYRFVARVATRPPEFGSEAAARRLHSRARYFFEKRTADALHRSIYYYRRALEAAPRFGAAYAGLARAYVLSAEYLYLPPNEAFPPAATAAETALALDGPAVEPYLVLGQVACYYTRDFAAADHWYGLAVELDSDVADTGVFLAWLRCIEGRAAEASAALADAVRAEPFSTVVQTTFAVTLIFERRLDEGIAILRETLARDGMSPHARLYLAQALQVAGGGPEIVALCSDPYPDGYEQEFLALRACGRIAMGDRSGAEQIAAEIRALGAHGRFVSSYNLALIALALDQPDEAVRLLERSLAERDPWVVLALHHPQVDALRDRPDFQALVGRIARASA
jgi:DNA-binding winged helix-turn-helix (wHTH) protein